MHSWRFIPRVALLCLPVALVASGFALSGAHDGQTDVGAVDRSVSRPPAAVQPKAAPRAAQPKAPNPTPAVKSQQTVVPAVNTAKPVDKNLVAELPDTTTRNFGMVGVTWAADTKETNFAVTVRTKTKGSWSKWQDLELDDTTSGGRPGTEPVWVGKADGVAVRVLSPDGVKPDDIKVMTIDPGTTPEDAHLPTVTTAGYTTNGPIDGVVHATQTTDGAPSYTPQPAIISRAAWGARKNTKCDTPLTGDSTHGVIVHHTAGSNNYTKAESAAIVRGDQSYHMDGHGWCDIGYNFLVDKYGQIFEGRNGGIDRQVRAAHSGNGEVNTYAMGIAMAGTFDTTEPSAALKDSMVKLIGWRMGTNYLKAKGTYYVGETITASKRYGAHTLNMISGHQNVVSTACPGKLGEAWIGATGGLRDRVEDYIANYKSAIKTEAARLGTSLTGHVYIGEAPVSDGGRHTVFNKRDIWWSAATGAHSVVAPQIAAYKTLGNEKSQLGFPTNEYKLSSVSTVGVQRFANGSMYKVKSGTTIRNYSLWGDIAKMYVSLKEASGVLGAPRSNVVNYTTGVTRAAFADGYIAYTASTKKTVATRTNGAVIGTSTPIAKPAVTTGLSAVPTANSATLTWSAASGASYYGVCLKDEATDTACAKWFGNVKATSLNATGLVPTAGTDYSFTVLAYNTAGFSRSAESPFNLKAAVPAIASGLKAVPTSSGATLTWSAAAGAKYYGVCLMQEVTDTACWKWFGNITRTSLAVTGLKPTAGTDYVFTVLSYNDAGFSRSAKASFDLKTSSSAAGSVPTVATGLRASTTTSGATLSWSAASGAKYYGVCLMTAGTDKTCWKWFGNITRTSLALTGLKPTGGTDYFFTVLSYNDAGFSRSGKVAFDLRTSSSTKPAVATGLSASTTTSGATLTWSPPSGASYYGVCLMTAGTDTACWKWYGNITKTSLVLTGLAPTGGTDYFFTVLSYNANGFSRSAKASFDLATSSTNPGSTKTDNLTVPSSRTFTLTGHGFGHGIGMSQYGAQGAASAGLTYDKILSYYYPGTALGSKTGNIRVLLSKDTDPSVVVKARTGLVFRNVKSGAAITLPTSIGGAKVTYWQIVPKTGAATSSLLQYKTSAWHTYDLAAWTGDAQFEAGANAAALVLPSHDEVLYRGSLRSAVPQSGSTDRNTVNITSVDDYVRGVVAAEMPASWKPEALKAQSVAARTYGVRSLAPSRYYDICDTTSCQVYGGAGRETSTTDSAVAATKGRILTYGGTPAFTQFSSSSGGWSAAGNLAYLKAKADAYDDFSGNPVHDWTFSAKASTLEGKYSSIGTLKTLRITKRTGGGDWGGRVASITLTGSKGSRTLTGNDMRSALGLRSNWFRFN